MGCSDLRAETITVRVARIDAPGMAQPPHGQKARTVHLVISPKASPKDHTTDRVGRTVAEVFSDILIGLALVEDGQAYPLRGPRATCIGSTWARATRGSTWWHHPPVGPPTWTSIIRIGSWPRAQQLLRQGHTCLERNGDGEACGSLHR